MNINDLDKTHRYRITKADGTTIETDFDGELWISAVGGGQTFLDGLLQGGARCEPVEPEPKVILTIPDNDAHLPGRVIARDGLWVCQFNGPNIGWSDDGSRVLQEIVQEFQKVMQSRVEAEGQKRREEVVREWASEFMDKNGLQPYHAIVTKLIAIRDGAPL